MSPQRYMRIFLYLLGLGFFGLIVSCSAVPDRAGEDASPPALRALDATASPESPLAEAERVGIDESKPVPLPEGVALGGPPPEAGEAPGAFGLADAPVDAASVEVVSSPIDAPAPSGVESRALIIRPSPAIAPAQCEAGELGDVGTRLASDYRRHVGGFGDAGGGGPAPGAERIEAAARLVAWSFVGSAWSPDEPLLLDAVETLATASAPVELRLLAAAGLQRLGRAREARQILDAAYSEDPTASEAEPSGGAAATAPDSDAFALSSVTFARTIDGPGDFEPVDPGVVPPGYPVLVYGEFANATYDVRPESTSGAPVFHRSFVAYLQLVTASGDEIDRVDFLPPDRGRHVSRQPDAPINFWVRYLIPRELTPGSYRIRIHATDLVTERYATAELELLVGRGAPLYGRGS